MAPLNIYDFTVPHFIRQLEALSVILTKASTYPSSSTFPSVRLAPDMLPLTFQVQTACKMSILLLTKLSVLQSAPEFANDETDIAQLQSRLAQTVKILKSVKRDDFEGKDEAELEFYNRPMGGMQFVNERMVPNFYFHVTTAYDILRSQGVEIGKLDFLGVSSAKK